MTDNVGDKKKCYENGRKRKDSIDVKLKSNWGRRSNHRGTWKMGMEKQRGETGG